MKICSLSFLAKLFCCVLLCSQFAYAQQTGRAGGSSPGFINTSGQGGQLAHIQQGAFGSFGANNRWIGIGQPSGVPEEVYGLRIQDRGIQATFSLNGNGAANKDLEIQWGSNNQSRLNFNFANSNFTVLPVMSLDAVGRLTASNRVRANSTNSNAAEFTEIGHGGSSGFVNTVGDGFLDFRHDGVTELRLDDSGRLGVNRTAASFFNLDVAGPTRTTQLFETSDRRVKKNITPLRDADIEISQGSMSSATERLLQLEGVTYELDSEQFDTFNEGAIKENTQIGFIAQDVVELFPELVTQDDEGIYSIRYTGLIPVLVEGVKDQQAIISNQSAIINELDTKVKNLEHRLNTVLDRLK